jgi:undecaprenyl pyrophosphate synthase
MKEFELMYNWNRNCEIHEIFDYYGTNFIRDNERLSNRLYHDVLEEKYQRLFPDCLLDINFYLRTVKNAIEISEELNIFFNDDDDLMCFSNWLRRTSKHCDMYELSR